MITAILGVGLASIALGGGACTVRRGVAPGLILQSVGAVALTMAGFWTLIAGRPIGQGFTNAFEPRFGVDPLSGAFLATLGLVAAPALLFSVRYLRGEGSRRTIAALTAAFLLALALVLCARDPLTLLLGWEVMTLLPAAVILVSRSGDARARRTVLTYVTLTHLGGIGTWTAVLLLARHGALGHPQAIAPGSGLQVTIAVAALVGMGTKAGVIPLHVWLPRAHPIAPAPVSALMSGVMIKVAVYALIRVLLDWLGVLPAWFGVVVLATGAVSALGGVTYAIFQHELKQLLALHSIENIGIIVLGLGAALVLRARGEDTWAAFALAAALLHTLNHAIFKALLFLCAGSFQRAAGTLDLDRMGGLLRRMPWTGAAFLVGAMAIAGLPPLNGFASEWATLQALLRLPLTGHLGDGLAGALALAGLAATAALALLCFVKVVGLVLLGGPRPGGGADRAVEAPRSMVAAVTFLATICLVLGLAPGLLFGSLARVLGTLGTAGPATAQLPTASAPTLPTPHVAIGLHLPTTGSLPGAGIGVLLFVLAGILVLARGRHVAPPAPSWACGQVVGPELNWTGAGFTTSLRLVLAGVLRPRSELTTRSSGGVLHEIRYRAQVPPLIDERVYRPLAHRSLRAAGRLRRLQSGSLATYLTYLIASTVALLGAARLGVLG